nr:myomegalin-like [Equus asinus]
MAKPRLVFPSPPGALQPTVFPQTEVHSSKDPERLLTTELPDPDIHFLWVCSSSTSTTLSISSWALELPGAHPSELGLDASLRMKTPPTLKGDALECSDASKQGCQVIGHIDASIVIQQRILERKLRLSKWRLACRFPGLQA